jgi:hypothetical protein
MKTNLTIRLTMDRCQIENDVTMPIDPPGETLTAESIEIRLHYMHVIRKMENGQEVWYAFPLTPRQQGILDRKLFRSGIKEAKRKQRKPKFTKQIRGAQGKAPRVRSP